jgi:hypothetical protein
LIEIVDPAIESEHQMTKPSIFAEIRNARVERILEAKQSRLLTSPWMRRTLSLVAIISSYAVMATLLIPTPYTISKTNRIYNDYEAIQGNWIYEVRDTTQGLAILFLIWSFILLRISMRRATLLPNEYLDELQITNRDWAFKNGYLVVRRIGLGVAIFFAFLATFGNQMVSFSAGNGPTVKAWRAFERYLSDLSTADPFGFYFKAFLLLAFVAYSFPIILLAWREARFPEAIPEVNQEKEFSPREKTANFYFKAIKWLVICLAIVASLYTSPSAFMILGPVLYFLLIPVYYWAIPGALVLFVWASITTAKGIILAKKTGLASQQHKRWANISTAFLILTLALGLIVGTTLFTGVMNASSSFFPGFPNLLLAILAGLLMIPAQALSMTFYAKLKTN